VHFLGTETRWYHGKYPSLKEADFFVEKRKIIVIKIGSSVLMTRRDKPDEFRISHLADQVVTLQSRGFAVVLVVSGAVATGMNFLTITYTSDRLHMLDKGDFRLLKQAFAGIGQAQLITIFNNVFNQKQMRVAQVLLNKDDLENIYIRERIKKILELYQKLRIIPIFNENDVVGLNSFGGNDYLAAEIAKLSKADKVMILSSYGKSVFGVGGGESKEKVCKQLSKLNIETIILNGKIKNILLENIH
jgi:glutamate 5-kinase